MKRRSFLSALLAAPAALLGRKAPSPALPVEIPPIQVETIGTAASYMRVAVTTTGVNESATVKCQVSRDGGTWVDTTGPAVLPSRGDVF